EAVVAACTTSSSAQTLKMACVACSEEFVLRFMAGPFAPGAQVAGVGVGVGVATAAIAIGASIALAFAVALVVAIAALERRCLWAGYAPGRRKHWCRGWAPTSSAAPAPPAVSTSGDPPPSR